MRAALYARFSTDEQNPRSADDQLAECRKLAAKLGAEVVAEFKDEAISGTHDNRPGRRALMGSAERGEFEMVITEGLDRMARSGGGTWDAYEDLAALAITIHTLDHGEIDLFKTGVYALQSAGFIDGLRKKVRRGLRAVTESGRHNAQPPYGYRHRIEHDARGERIRGLIEINPAEADVVRRIAREYLAGSTAHAIRTRLNNEGVPGPRGRLWSYGLINGREGDRNGILRNPIYAGELVWGRIRETKNRKTGKVMRREAPSDEIVRKPSPHLRIIDPETWSAIQARLTERRAQVLAAGNASACNAPRRLLTGLIRCGACGGAMHTTGGERRFRCVARMSKGAEGCINARTVPPEWLEAYVLDEVRRDLLHPDVIEAFVREYHEGQRKRGANAGAERAAIERELAETKRRAGRLVDQVADGILKGPTIAAKLAEMETRIATLETSLNTLKRSAEIMSLHPRAAARYRELVEDLRSALETPGAASGSAKFDEARTALRRVVRAVIIHPLPERGRVRVELQGDLSSLLASAGPVIPPRKVAHRK